MRAHFIVGRPFGEAANPEAILEGPFPTLEAAADALEAHHLNHGVPARVATLAEAVEPVAYVCLVNGHEIVEFDDGRDVACLDEADDMADAYDGDAVVYGLVPVGG